MSNMPVKIYGTQNCVYCQKAKQLCREMRIGFTYYPIDSVRGELFEEFQTLFPNAKTVPQILWDDQHIGGYNELVTHIENLNLGNYGQGDL